MSNCDPPTEHELNDDPTENYDWEPLWIAPGVIAFMFITPLIVLGFCRWLLFLESWMGFA